MSEKPDRPAIPAWQRASQPAQVDEPSSTAAKDGKVQGNDTEVIATSPDLAAAEPSSPPNSADTTQTQREQIRAFLQDPVVKNQSTEKKRTFLKGKDMPAHLIDEELGALSKVSLDTQDFAGFREHAISEEQSQIQQQTLPPAIITYPEFLANAHSAPPLITPTRILATTYIASATAALAYAASTFLIKPMTASLTDARHELAMHSLHQVDDFNSRLEKLVSQIPSAKPDSKEADDNESVASEPTELFSRDQATQTAEIIAQATDHASKVTILEPTATTKQAEKLDNLQKHLDAILAGTQKEGKAFEERGESVKRLRQYLDSLSYGSSGINVWSNTAGQFSWEQNDQQKEKEKKEDAIEDLKREIRGVKGVLLSAKRFPAAGRAPNTTTPQYSTWRGGIDAPV